MLYLEIFPAHISLCNDPILSDWKVVFLSTLTAEPLRIKTSYFEMKDNQV